MSYTFGDHQAASRRLRRPELYEPETRGLLELARDSGKPLTLRLAVDLGCGPGWTTQLLDSVLKPQRTVGLDSSERYIAEARANYPKLEFLRHDILQTPFPVEEPDLFLCRFLLTHLPSPQTALLAWANVAAPLSTLLIHETEQLESNHAALRRYYELVEEMQRHYGQKLNVGATLDGNFAGTGWRVQQSRSFSCGMVRAGYGSATLAESTYLRQKRICCSGFDRRELDQLEARHSIP